MYVVTEILKINPPYLTLYWLSLSQYFLRNGIASWIWDDASEMHTLVLHVTKRTDRFHHLTCLLLPSIYKPRSWNPLWRVRLNNSSNRTPCRWISNMILRYLINSEQQEQNHFSQANTLHFLKQNHAWQKWYLWNHVCVCVCVGGGYNDIGLYCICCQIFLY